jgi:hypothetical protein
MANSWICSWFLFLTSRGPLGWTIKDCVISTADRRASSASEDGNWVEASNQRSLRSSLSGGVLACHSHQSSTAKPELIESTSLHSCRPPRRTSSTPSVGLGRKPCIFNQLRLLATNTGEKDRLTEPARRGWLGTGARPVVLRTAGLCLQQVWQLRTRRASFLEDANSGRITREDDRMWRRGLAGAFAKMTSADHPAFARHVLRRFGRGSVRAVGVR